MTIQGYRATAIEAVEMAIAKNKVSTGDEHRLARLAVEALGIERVSGLILRDGEELRFPVYRLKGLKELDINPQEPSHDEPAPLTKWEREFRPDHPQEPDK